MKLNFSKYSLFYFALFLCIAVIIVVVLFALNTAQPARVRDVSIPRPISPKLSDVLPSIVAARPPTIKSLPRNGNAINTTVPVVSSSQEEIAKIQSSLPYLYDFTTTFGRQVSIVVPSRQYQDDPWKLTAQVFGVDYKVASSSSSYVGERNNFIESAQTIFGWIKQQGGNPNAVIIRWGDEAYIQNKAEEWLGAQ